MNTQLYWNIFSTLFGFALIAGAGVYGAFKAKLAQRKAKGDIAAYVLDAAGSMAEKLVYQAQITDMSNTNKKRFVSDQVSQALKKMELPNPGQQVIDGAVEQAVVSMKTAKGLMASEQPKAVEKSAPKVIEDTNELPATSEDSVGNLNA